MSTIRLDQVSKIYNNEGNSAIGIQNISLEFNLGEFVAITGESGSGKSTLLNVVSMMDTYEEGELFINGKSTVDFSRAEFADFRSNYVSFIFQEYNLVDSFSVLENVMLPLISRGKTRKEAKKIALEAIEKVGLKKVIKHKATHLSGGEKQRTVIARALVSDTPIIACDEPTGNLDSDTAKSIVNLLASVAHDKLILFVTHDYESISHVATRHVTLSDSHLESDVSIKKVDEIIDNKETKREHTKIRNIFHIGFKDVFSTPKKSILSLLITLLISLSSVAILSGAFALIGPASEEVTTSHNSYAEYNHAKNRAAAFGKGENGQELSSFEVSDDVFIDYGNIITSQTTITVLAGSLPYSCEEINIVHEGDELLPIDNSYAPVKETECALGVSKKIFNEFVSKAYAYDNYRRKFLSRGTVIVSPITITGIIYEYKPTAVFLIDNDDEFDYSLILSYSGMKLLYSRLYNIFKGSAPQGRTSTNVVRDPYLSEAKYFIETTPLTYNAAYDNYIDDIDFSKIYLPSSRKDFDLTISFRNSTVIVPSEDIVYDDNIPGIIIHQPAFTRYFADQKQIASYYSYSYSRTNKIVSDLLSKKFTAYRGSEPQSKDVEMSEHGYENLLKIIGYAAIFIASAILITFLGSLILGAIYNSQKKDYAIYSSLSFSRKEIRVINLIEISCFFILTSIFSYFLANLLTGNLSTYFGDMSVSSLIQETQRSTYEGLANTFSNLYSFISSPIFIVIYFIFNALFAVLVSTWIMNKFDRKTLANNLRKGGELL